MPGKDRSPTNQASLLKRYRFNAWSILIVGVSVGFIVIVTTLLGKPIPPAALLATMGALALFVVVQVLRNARLIKRLKHERDR